jgi:hypothetical protein
VSATGYDYGNWKRVFLDFSFSLSGALPFLDLSLANERGNVNLAARAGVDFAYLNIRSFSRTMTSVWEIG